MKGKEIEPSLWLDRLRETEFWKTSKKVTFFLYAIFGVAFYLLLIGNVLPMQYELKEGSISPNTITAPATIIDEAATQKAKERAAQGVPPVFTKDDKVTNDQIGQIDHFFSEVRSILSEKSLNETEKKNRMKEIVGGKEEKLSEEFFGKLVRTPVDDLTEIRVGTREIVAEIMGDGVKEAELAEKTRIVEQKFATLSPHSRDLVQKLAKFYIIPNEFPDAPKTKALQEAAMNNADLVKIEQGQNIVTKGEKITADQYEKLKKFKILSSTNLWGSYIGLALLLVVVLIFFYLFIGRFHPSVAHDNFKIIMLFLVLTICMTGMKLIAIGQNLDEWSILGYLSPAALGGMLVTLLLNVELGFLCIVYLSIVTSMFFSGEGHQLFDFRFGLVALMGGVVSAFSLSGVKRRSSVLYAGIFGSIASVVTIMALFFIFPAEGWSTIWRSLTLGLVGSIFCSILTIGFLPGFESLFGILSPLRLLELSNPNHPLLKKLLYDAPGTYHHSVIVGNLAESGAEAIGANGLLARVGAYYHDLGKTKRPQFFIENQIGKENPHDKISPNLSKTIIISHTRDGVEMLKQYRIPEPIQDIAAQHHGTTLIKYFYFKALEATDGMNVIEEDYRYPGPKPQFKEAAIVGIADCVEAAVRSVAKPTPSRIEGVIKKIIQQRLEDGQFDECDLTIKELDLITQAMCATLQGIFHNRIEYPEGPTLTGKGAKQH
ncbi:putative nucleotidyltransferase with HDIG domain [Croceifilum oryzae]|uniref:Nucleotidyltransferase with HDIG domain n=1 Tax=Croceifilum oryzae TaxID=1553429 RepID=A0AAJ1TFU1_9BACL|nr:HD family phosphohydrolase [Croceifilum oryzae]MDQ0416257.1 putative nucleotidyltransferase with HDIG domain [Croceifilum oryzae]